jgi:cytochrome c oxidase subunit 1
MEHAAVSRGGSGLFGWWRKLPYFDTERWMFPYLFCGLVLFYFGGITGIINASGNMNMTVHNTAWIPAHFHTTIAGPVFLSFLGMSLMMICQFRGVSIPFPKLNLWTPWMWLLGVCVFSTGLSVAGILGEPRRTNMGLTYANPESPSFMPQWQLWDMIGVVGGVLMFLAVVIFFVNFFGALFSKARVKAGDVQFPTAEALHDEPAGVFANFKPWVALMILAILMAYVPTLYQISTGDQQKAVPYRPWSPAPDVRK